MISDLLGPLPAVEQIKFGKLFAPTFVIAEYKGGQWTDFSVEPLRMLELHPAAVVFHYGQAIFEGLKGYLRSKGEVALFRPELNAERFVSSAERLALPVLSEPSFIEALVYAVDANLDYVPGRPGSLYLRPTMIGSEPCIGVRGSTEALFFVLALPAGSYFRDGKEAIDVFVSETMARSARGGTGNVKASANYAPTLKSIYEAKQIGCDQVLYLDSLNRGLVEEMGGMNIFFLVDDRLVTPPLGGTILPGITRATVIETAHALGLPVEERPISLREIKEATRAGKLTEAFACGTAATIVGINRFILESGGTLQMPVSAPGPVTRRLLAYVQDVQYGEIPDRHGWMRVVKG